VDELQNEQTNKDSFKCII